MNGWTAGACGVGAALREHQSYGRQHATHGRTDTLPASDSPVQDRGELLPLFARDPLYEGIVYLHGSNTQVVVVVVVVRCFRSISQSPRKLGPHRLWRATSGSAEISHKRGIGIVVIKT